MSGFRRRMEPGLLRGRGVDEPTHGGNAVGREASALGVFANGGFVGSKIDAIEFVAGDIALQPLNFWTHGPENREGLARGFLQFRIGEISQPRYFPLDHKLRHVVASGTKILASPGTCYNTGLRQAREGIVDLRSVQKPLKEQYRNDPSSSRITLKAKGGQTETPIACSVAIGRAIYNAEAHSGVGGAGTAACSGDMLLGALSACAQITCQMVAAAMGIATERIEVTVEGDLDLRGTLGIAKDVPVGFESIRVRFDITAAAATAEQLRSLQEKTEQYCVVMQTLVQPPRMQTEWVSTR